VLEVAAAAVPPRVLLKAGDPAREALAALGGARLLGAPVVDPDGTYLGTADRDRLTAALDSDAEATAGDCADLSAQTVSADADLHEAIDALNGAGGQWVTVTDGQRRVAGILTAGAVVRLYRDAVEASEPARASAG
jgi:predicted transcriptional regulator